MLAAVASLAEVESEGAGAVAEVSAEGAGASVFLPQALKTKAAAIALITSLVFIYRYPKLIFNVETTQANWLVLDLPQDFAVKFRVFPLTFLILSVDTRQVKRRETRLGLNCGTRRAPARPRRSVINGFLIGTQVLAGIP